MAERNVSLFDMKKETSPPGCGMPIAGKVGDMVSVTTGLELVAEAEVTCDA